MGQKVSPVGLRLGIIRGWDSNWYGGKQFASKIVEDDKIRKYLNARLFKAGIAKIYIERTLKLVTVTLFTARPGLIIGKGGTEVEKLKEELKKITSKDIQINIAEVKRPDLNAELVAQNIARQIEGRVSYRKAVKTAIGNTMRSNAEGIKVSVSGRLGGAEIARTEHFKEGRTPLHTLRADIDYALAEAHTTYGGIDTAADTHVLDANGEPVPGLFAAGECTNKKTYMLGNAVFFRQPLHPITQIALDSFGQDHVTDFV